MAGSISLSDLRYAAGAGTGFRRSGQRKPPQRDLRFLCRPLFVFFTLPLRLCFSLAASALRARRRRKYQTAPTRMSRMGTPMPKPRMNRVLRPSPPLFWAARPPAAIPLPAVVAVARLSCYSRKGSIALASAIDGGCGGNCFGRSIADNLPAGIPEECTL